MISLRQLPLIGTWAIVGKFPHTAAIAAFALFADERFLDGHWQLHGPWPANAWLLHSGSVPHKPFFVLVLTLLYLSLTLTPSVKMLLEPITTVCSLVFSWCLVLILIMNKMPFHLVNSSLGRPACIQLRINLNPPQRLSSWWRTPPPFSASSYHTMTMTQEVMFQYDMEISHWLAVCFFMSLFTFFIYFFHTN